METKKMKKTKRPFSLGISVLVIAALGGCGDSLPPTLVTAKVYTQIERLARPAINEGLVITNAFLNAYNSIAPSLDLSVAAAPVLAEAGVTLKLLAQYGKNNGYLPTKSADDMVGDVVNGFIPDVMRVDTDAAISVGKWAYNGDFTLVQGTSSPILTGGRKLEDDSASITASYLITGIPSCGPGVQCRMHGGVTYAGGMPSCSDRGKGSNHANPGHQCLHGQTAENGSAQFPFAAAPN